MKCTEGGLGWIRYKQRVMLTVLFDLLPETVHPVVFVGAEDQLKLLEEERHGPLVRDEREDVLVRFTRPIVYQVCVAHQWIY